MLQARRRLEWPGGKMDTKKMLKEKDTSQSFSVVRRCSLNSEDEEPGTGCLLVFSLSVPAVSF